MEDTAEDCVLWVTVESILNRQKGSTSDIRESKEEKLTKLFEELERVMEE